ncbi:MAG TPA: RNA polymerase sigma factor [bacterium]|jgi:RNA polymerase sigma-70 factor (ECF subfamily)|nr:RNA polymerase sigma factor [bacterium]
MTELEAIQHCQNGDIAGLHVLYEMHRKKVYNLSWRMLGTPQDGEDALQEVFLKVFDRIKNYRGDSAFSTWLYRMTTNHCLDLLRRRKILTFLGFENAPEAQDKKDSEKAVNLGLSPVIAKALEKLPEKQKACLLMREMDELSYEDIASALQLSLGSVKSNIHRAKAFLKETLEKEGLSHEDV